VTNGARAGVVVVFARTSDDGVGAFLVTPDSEGYSVGASEKTMGLRASQTVRVELDGVLVPRTALVGDERAGLRYALEALDLGRIGIAAHAVGVGRAALEHATTYALGREQFEQPIARFGAIQAKLADMAQRLAGGRALAHSAAAALDAARNGRGHPRTGLDGVTARAAVAKLAASEAATRTAAEAIQLYGGYGYMRHYPVEKLLRDAKGAEIYEGTSEVLRQVIAREILRDAGA
jgi:alkylation response protein AidB-like acyl-CoA dehydrogenase